MGRRKDDLEDGGVLRMPSCPESIETITRGPYEFEHTRNVRNTSSTLDSRPEQLTQHI